EIQAVARRVGDIGQIRNDVSIFNTKQMVSGARLAVLNINREDIGVTGSDLKHAATLIEEHRPASVHRNVSRRFCRQGETGAGHEAVDPAGHSWVTSLAYSPLLPISFSCVPRSVTLPCRSTMISSQSRMVLRRCAMMMQVHPRLRRLSSMI